MTLQKRLLDHGGPRYCLKKGEVPKIEYTFCAKGIVDLGYQWEYCDGQYPNGGYQSYVFDCAQGKRVLLSN